MKLNKKTAGLIAGVVCVILLLVALLSMCNSGGEEQVEATAPVVETTEAVAETTEATEVTEETTEPTEETTEPTEETTAPTEPTTGGNTGYVPDSGNNDNNSNPPEVETIPTAGSEGSPYTEMIAALPDSFCTVAIPVDSTVFHNLYMESGAILTVQNPDAYVVYGGTKYEVNENGILTLTLATPEKDTPVSLQIGNKNAEEKAFALEFSPAPGSSQNPEIIPEGETVENGKWTQLYSVKLDAGNQTGYWYQYTAETMGKLVLLPDGATENPGYDIIVTVGDRKATLSESQDGTATLDVQPGDVASIQIIAIPGEDGNYPAVDASIRCEKYPAPGTIGNPLPADDVESIAVGPLNPGEEIYFYADKIADVKLRIDDTVDAYIRIGEEKYIPENNRVLVTIPADSGRVLFSVGNDGDTNATYTLTLAYPEGSKMNPKKWTNANHANVQFDTTKEHYYYWVATGSGKFTATMNTNQDEPQEWSFFIQNVTSGEIGTVHTSSDDPIVTVDAIGFAKGDMVQLVVKGNGCFTTKAAKKDTSIVSGTELLIGENLLKPMTTVITTVYRFTPDESGTYTFETDAGTLSYWGSGLEGMANATASESAKLTQAAAEGEYILVGVTGVASCKLTVTKTVAYGTDVVPVAYTVALEENQEITAIDLTASYNPILNQDTGFYHLGENGSVILVDFSDNRFVNLKTAELYCEITAEDGTVLRETYHSLLQKYAAAAQVITVSEEKTATVYPLTEELVYILKQAGRQLGWYDCTHAAYLFAGVTNAQPDSLWLFPCSYIRTVEVPVTEQTITE